MAIKTKKKESKVAAHTAKPNEIKTRHRRTNKENVQPINNSQVRNDSVTKSEKAEEERLPKRKSFIDEKKQIIQNTETVESEKQSQKSVSMEEETEEQKSEEIQNIEGTNNNDQSNQQPEQEEQKNQNEQSIQEEKENIIESVKNSVASKQSLKQKKVSKENDKEQQKIDQIIQEQPNNEVNEAEQDQQWNILFDELFLKEKIGINSLPTMDLQNPVNKISEQFQLLQQNAAQYQEEIDKQFLEQKRLKEQNYIFMELTKYLFTESEKYKQLYQDSEEKLNQLENQHQESDSDKKELSKSSKKKSLTEDKIQVLELLHKNLMEREWPEQGPISDKKWDLSAILQEQIETDKTGYVENFLNAQGFNGKEFDSEKSWLDLPAKIKDYTNQDTSVRQCTELQDEQNNEEVQENKEQEIV